MTTKGYFNGIVAAADSSSGGGLAWAEYAQLVAKIGISICQAKEPVSATHIVSGTVSSIGRCTVPVMMTGAVDQHRPMEIPGCQAHRCRCPNARRSASR